MINVTTYALVNGTLVEQVNFTRPFQGADNLARHIMDFTLQPQANTLAPFTEFKIVANDGTTSRTRYFVVGDSESTKERMGD